MIRKWWRRWRNRCKMVDLIRGAIYDADSISVATIVAQSGATSEDVHKFCRNYVRVKRLQRLRNTPGIDYYPIGSYGGYIRFPHPDGTPNPFLARLDPAKKKPDIEGA